MKYLSTIRSFLQTKVRPNSKKRNSSSIEKNLSGESLVEGKYHPKFEQKSAASIHRVEETSLQGPFRIIVSLLKHGKDEEGAQPPGGGRGKKDEKEEEEEGEEGREVN